MTYSSGKSEGFTGLEKAVRLATKAIKPHLDDFDVILCTGISGLIAASPVALRLKKPLVVLRKDDEKCHGTPGDILGWNANFKRVLFFDDFVSTGATFRRCAKAVEGKAEIVLQCEYQPWSNAHRPVVTSLV